MRYLFNCTLFLLGVCQFSCKQQQAKPAQENTSKKNNPGAPPRENSAGPEAVRLAATSKVPVSMVRHIRQASNGDILIASYLGVFRYNIRFTDSARPGGNDSPGQEAFTNLTNIMSPPITSSFWDVLEDRKGNLWFGTRDSGVYLLPAGQTTFQHFTTRDGLASNYGATHLYEDRAGNIWVGANRYDAGLPASAAPGGNDKTGQGKPFRTLSTKDGFPSNHIRLLLEDKTGKLWFGAQGEDMFVYDGKTFTVLKNKDGKTFHNVWSVTEDTKGNIWFGADDGLWRYDPSGGLLTDSRNFTHVSRKGAYAIIQDKKGNIWTTGPDEPARIGQLWSLSQYDAGKLYSEIPTVTKIKSAAGMLLGILEDIKGNIWFGAGNGVYRYDGTTITDFKGKQDRY